MLRFRNAARPRAVLGWALVGFVAAQLGVGLFLVRHPEVREPEYGSLLNGLRVHQREMPGRPLVLILGSSRSANLFRPSPPASHTDPLLFNFATFASGPLRQLQMLRRLLARGVRPHAVVAELWPPFLNQYPGCTEEEFIRDRDLQPADGPLLARYFTNPWPAYVRLAEGLAVPAYSYRSKLLGYFHPFANDPGPGPSGYESDPPPRAAESFGWLPALGSRSDPEEFRRRLAYAADYTRTRLADFRIRPVADEALRDLLRTCARNGIRTALVLLPEHRSLGACYSPGVVARVDAYLAGLSREEQVPVVDTRGWVSDDDFLDGLHALPQAAGPYTERFRREVLPPLLRGDAVPAALSPPAPGGPQG
jgi:hypothetical protein